MGHQKVLFVHPRKYGQGSRTCRVCTNHHGLIRKYGLNMCRRCFRQHADVIGFKKMSVWFLGFAEVLVTINYSLLFPLIVQVFLNSFGLAELDVKQY